MEYIRTTENGPRLSRVALGCEALGGTDWGDVDLKEVGHAVEVAWERGITTYDTAEVYGLGASEKRLAEALGSSRHEAVIVTKFGFRWAEPAPGQRAAVVRDTSPRKAQEAVASSLKRLRLDRIPVVLVHWPDANTPLRDTISALADMQRKGDIAHIGLSNPTPAGVREAGAHADISVVQSQFSMLHRQSWEELRSAVAEVGAVFMSYGVLAQGLLTGKYDASSVFPDTDRRSRLPWFQTDAFAAVGSALDMLGSVAVNAGRPSAQIAVAWALRSIPQGVAIVGAKNAMQVASSIDALDVDLPNEDWATLDSASRRVPAALFQGSS